MDVEKGIDVSHHQGDIHFGKVKAAGVRFVMLRAGYGWENPKAQTDRKFERNYRGAAEAGLPCGAYHYSYATNRGEAEREADFFLRLTEGKRFAYPLAFDLEDRAQAGLGRAALTEIAETFCSAVERAGYYVCLYSNPDWLKNRLDMERLKRFDLWLARYAASPGRENIGLWQYSSAGRVDGIAGPVDLDLAYRDYPAIMREKGLNGFPKEALPPKQYTVRSGDTMSGIAARFGVALGALIRANPQAKDPDRIFPGNTLTIPD